MSCIGNMNIQCSQKKKETLLIKWYKLVISVLLFSEFLLRKHDISFIFRCSVAKKDKTINVLIWQWYWSVENDCMDFHHLFDKWGSWNYFELTKSNMYKEIDSDQSRNRIWKYFYLGLNYMTDDFKWYIISNNLNSLISFPLCNES